MITVSLYGNGDSISIEVVGYENANATNESDANWLTCKVDIVARPFSGRFDMSLTTQDLDDFRKQLEQLLQILKGKAIFYTDADSLRFEIEMGSRGAANVRAVAKVDGRSTAVLTFTFETDQSYLAQTKSALDELSRNFPIRQKPGMS